MRFINRRQAGILLCERLLDLPLHEPLLLALPRGGVPVAYESAIRLGAELEVLVVRKIGVPWHEELGMGGLAENCHLWMDPSIVEYVGCTQEDINRMVATEEKELERRVRLYRGGRPLPSLRNRSAVIIDDGIAMGVTARAACGYARAQGASQVVLAVPVCSSRTAGVIRKEVDEFICLLEPDEFYAVGQFYEEFNQVTDEEVLHFLKSARARRENRESGDGSAA